MERVVERVVLKTGGESGMWEPRRQMRQGDLPGKGILAENNSQLFVIFKFVLAMTVNQNDLSVK